MSEQLLETIEETHGFLYFMSMPQSCRKVFTYAISLDPLLLDRSHINTLYEVVLADWIQDHERNNGYDDRRVLNGIG